MFININKTDEKETIKGTWNVMRKTSELQFWIGNPSVDLISGVLHFYPFVTISKKEENPVSVRSNILAIVSIPNSMDVTEIYYMFKELQNEIQVIRVLKTSFINHYSIIIKFKTTESANLFYVKNNQTKFNSIEDDICIIREIETIEMKQEKVDLSPELGPANPKENKNSQEALPKDMFSLTLEQNSPDIKKDWQQLTAYENQYKCPICLEPIPEVQIQDKISSLAKKSAKTNEPHPDFGDSAIISILCGHFFHIACLEKWNESKCPICRYNQHPLESSKCDFCGTNEALWMCIVCGFIGCAPPDGPMNGHIREHYDISKHIYAVELETKCVFDFSKNGFVQRLLQNIRDGKIIQHESTPMPDSKMYQNEELEKRLDNIIYEYNLLLSSQYQSQKEYYQSQLNKASKEHEQKVRKLEEEKKILQEEDRVILDRFKEAENEFEDKKKEFFDLKETFTKLDNEKRELEKRNKELTAQQQGLISSHQSFALSQEEEIDALREEAAALAMQIKDLETHIQTKDKLKIAFSKEGVDADNTHILMSSKAHKGKKKGK